ncbi:MAG: nitrogenase iron-molybdenum cofactor biosynthesis protein NifE [Deltaproteobacteria bacterium]|nr:nitrogenase iron-molybdenum cofactor biosynthesis protein NifE [Deltaproteobacteria bacterium]
MEERRKSISLAGGSLDCDKASLAGAVSQRACVYCGARVVLNPITDAFHLVHGPIGCASYTWDIRGSLSAGSELYRQSFSTDLRERDIVFGGEAKLRAGLREIAEIYRPPVIFIYATCVVGVIGDDVEAVAREAEKAYGIRVIVIQSPGFAGHKSLGYRLAGEALMKLLSPQADPASQPQARQPQARQPKVRGLNILGDYNLAGEMWIIKNYYREIGLPVIASFTGDSTCAELRKAPTAALNVVQCAGSMTYLAKRLEEEYGIPWIKASFFGLEDTARALRETVDLLGSAEERSRAEALIARESRRAEAAIKPYLPGLKGKKAAIFVGGGFKAISLIRQFRALGLETVLVGTQTGQKEEYEVMANLASPGTVILDDANPSELEAFMREKGADILVGGVKERPLAYKLGVAFCDHNHERQAPLAGFVGVENFTREIDLTINSPVWSYVQAAGVTLS